MPEESTIKLVTDVLDSLIDAQRNYVMLLTEIRDKEGHNHEKIQEIRSYFTNGFRSKIDEALKLAKQNQADLQILHDTFALAVSDLTDAQEKQTDQMEEISKNMKGLVDTVKKPWWWIKNILIGLVALGPIFAGLLRLVQYLGG